MKEVRWRMIALVGLSLSIGWGIRGNFGHEWGAAIAGVLSAMAVVLIAAREDWLRRIAYFAVFGAVGWSFGATISYMQVIAYTHSGHSLSVWYGFVCLFIIGFLWASMGGAATALPAFLSRERLAEFFAPMIGLFLTWWVSGTVQDHIIAANPAYQDHDPFDWYDTDWIAALLAIVVILLFALIRRKLDKACSLILHMAVGWWAAFLILVVGLGLRMTPPRGDSWAGCVGMVIGMLIYLQRNGLTGVTFVSLLTGFIGGLGFASATLFKLVELTSGLDTNWHSILEQTYGLINGIGVAVAMGLLSRRAPRLTDEPPTRHWTEPFAVSIVLLLVTYLNLQKIVNDWVQAKTVPETLYFLSAHAWFDLAYAGLAGVFLVLLREHLRRPLPLIPTRWLGKGQMFYLLFLWWMILGNFLKAVVAFAPQRLVTEGTLHFNALLCTLLVLLATRTPRPPSIIPPVTYGPMIRKVLLVGLLGMALTTLLDWGVVRAIYGNRFSGYAGHHIRFGPNATIHGKP